MLYQLRTHHSLPLTRFLFEDKPTMAEYIKDLVQQTVKETEIRIQKGEKGYPLSNVDVLKKMYAYDISDSMTIIKMDDEKNPDVDYNELFPAKIYKKETTKEEA